MPTSASNPDSFKRLLPRLRSDHNNRNIAPGAWQPLTSADVRGLSDDFDVQAPEDAHINSMPDLWARPLLFQLALYDPQHSLHRRIVAEWRGLLAILAFKERRQLPVRQVEVRLDADKNAGLLGALGRMAPANTLHPTADWHELHLLTWQTQQGGEQPIGMLSPTTLVATAASCQGRIDRLPWFDFKAHCLLDPSAFLNPTEKGDLVQWLHPLRVGVANLPPVEGGTAASAGFDPVQFMHDKLLGLLDAFMADLGGMPATVNPGLIDTQRGFGFMSRLYEGMNYPLGALDILPQQSHVRLVPSAERQPARDVLVLDPSIARQFGRSENEIFVSSSLDLGQALAYPNRANVQGSRASLWNKDNFFTRRLLCVTGFPNAFPGTLPIRGADQLRHGQGVLAPLPPIRAEVLEYLTGKDLSEGLSFQQEGDAIKVNLIVTLSGPEGRGRRVTLDKIYRDADIDRVENLPIVEVWPNLANSQANPWKSYYTYFSTVEHSLADPQGHALTFAARPYPAADPSRVVTYAGGWREVQRLEQFPEAFVCEASQGEAGTALAPVGLLLLRPPKEVGGQPVEWSVGIDFGTSSTNVYYRSSDDETPKPMRFHDHMLSVTRQDARDRELFSEFIPGAEVPTPFLTLFRVREINRRLQSGRPVLDGSILYLGAGSEAFQSGDVRLKLNIKWSKEGDHQEITLAFLRQLALQCAAEALAAGATAIRWCFSYPSAFTINKISEFRANWRTICEDTEAETGVKWLPGTAQANQPAEKTESLAVACYFIELHHATPAAGAMFVDIGGGTTDISLWHGAGQNRRDLQLQTSVQFAGRELFIQPLYHYGRNLLPDLLVDERSRAAGSQLRTNMEQFSVDRPAYQAFGTLIDTVVTQYNREFMRNLPRLSARDDSRALKAAIALRFCGLLHYVGLLVGATLRRDPATPPVPGEHMPNFYFGGNGARVLHWLELGSFNDTTNSSRHLLKPILALAAGFPADAEFRLELSGEPKAEVAAGLVVPNTPETPVGSKPKTISGEAFTLPGDAEAPNARKSFPWSDPLTEDSVAGSLQLGSLDQFKRFLANYTKYVTALELPAPGPLSSMQEREVFNRVQHQLTPGQPEEVSVEPLFILALKAYLSLKP